jgi:hypothetical protein
VGTTPGGWTRAGRPGIGQLTGGGRLASIDAELPRLWDDAPGSRRALAEALFERIEVLGLRRMRIEATPTAIASGPVEAFSRALGGYGRGERLRDSHIAKCNVPLTPAVPLTHTGGRSWMQPATRQS